LITKSDHQVVNKKVKKQPQKTVRKTYAKKTARRSLTEDDGEIWICSGCSHQYGDNNDPRRSEDWLQCTGCMKTYHMSCAEQDGVVDDDETFNCKDCIC